MRRGVALRLHPVARPRQHRAVRPQHHGADRHLAARRRRARLLQRRFHQRRHRASCPPSPAGATDPRMSARIRPVIGVTLDAEPPGGYSKYPWYALRANYADARSPQPAACRSPCRTTRRWPPPISTRSTPWSSPAAPSTSIPACTATRAARDGHPEGGPHRRRAGARPRRAGPRQAGAGHLRRRAAAGGGARRHAAPAHPRRRRRARWSTSSRTRATSPATPSPSCPARCSPASPGPARCR